MPRDSVSAIIARTIPSRRSLLRSMSQHGFAGQPSSRCRESKRAASPEEDDPHNTRQSARERLARAGSGAASRQGWFAWSAPPVIAASSPMPTERACPVPSSAIGYPRSHTQATGHSQAVDSQCITPSGQNWIFCHFVGVVHLAHEEANRTVAPTPLFGLLSVERLRRQKRHCCFSALHAARGVFYRTRSRGAAEGAEWSASTSVPRRAGDRIFCKGHLAAAMFAPNAHVPRPPIASRMQFRKISLLRVLRGSSSSCSSNSAELRRAQSRGLSPSARELRYARHAGTRPTRMPAVSTTPM